MHMCTYIHIHICYMHRIQYLISHTRLQVLVNLIANFIIITVRFRKITQILFGSWLITDTINQKNINSQYP